MSPVTSVRGRALRRAPKNVLLALAGLSAMLLLATPAAAQIVNGNFEAAPTTAGYTTVNAGSYIDAAHHWRVTVGSVDVGTAPAGTACTTAGGHCVDLNGNATGGIEQIVATVAGSACRVTFAMSRHKNLATSQASLNVLVNGVATPSGPFVHNVAGVTATNGQWQPHGFGFTSTGTSTTLEFRSAISGMAGPQVDDVAMTCVSQKPTGSVSVQKIVVNTLGVPSPATFSTTTHCSANTGTPGINTPIAVNAGQTVVQSTPVATGTICSVTEALPQPVPRVDACKGRGATWVATYSAPVTIGTNTTSLLTVTNTLTCDAPPPGGALTVNKNVVNTLGVPNPATWPITVHCTAPGLLTAPLNVPSGQSVALAAPVAGGSVCNVTEVLPPSVPNVKACNGGPASWSQSIPAPVTIVNQQSTVIIVTNTLACDRPTTGPLSVRKVVVNTLGVPNPATFDVMTHCGLTAAGPTVNTPTVLTAGQTATQSAPVALGSSCTVTETAPPQIHGVKACPSGNASWVTSYSPAVNVVASPAALLTVTNTLRCDPPSNTDCPNPGMSTIGCRVTLTIKRSKGPAIYSVNVTPAPTVTTPTPNILPSTATSCVIQGNAMINQVTCWYNYSAIGTSVTLTAVSSAGALPAGFNWTGACSGSSATCVVPATLNMPPSVIANFP